MIRVKFYQNKNDGRYIGFSVLGHANYAKHGKDIVCSAVSALVINTINSIGEFTDEHMIAEYGNGGSIKMKLCKSISTNNDIDKDSRNKDSKLSRSKSKNDAQLLIRALRLGLCEIYDEYGDRFIRLYFKEV